MANRPLPSATAASSAETSHNGTAGTPPRLAPSPRSMAAATRRTVLVGAAIAPFAAPTSAAATTPDRTEWDALVGAFRQAEAEQERLGVLHDADYDRWLKQPFEPKPEEPQTPDLDTSRPFSEFLAAGRTPEHRTAWAGYEVALAEWKARKKAAQAAVTGESETLYSDAMDARNVALLAVKQYPVSTLALLAEKAAILQGFYGDDGLEGDEASALIADIKRLAAQGGR